MLTRYRIGVGSVCLGCLSGGVSVLVATAICSLLEPPALTVPQQPTIVQAETQARVLNCVYRKEVEDSPASETSYVALASERAETDADDCLYGGSGDAIPAACHDEEAADCSDPFICWEPDTHEATHASDANAAQNVDTSQSPARQASTRDTCVTFEDDRPEPRSSPVRQDDHVLLTQQAETPQKAAAPVDRVCTLREQDGRTVVATMKLRGQVVSGQLEPHEASVEPADAVCPINHEVQSISQDAGQADCDRSTSEPTLDCSAKGDATLSDSVTDAEWDPTPVRQVSFDDRDLRDQVAPSVCVESSVHSLGTTARLPDTEWEVVSEIVAEPRPKRAAPEVAPGAMSALVDPAELEIARQAKMLIAAGELNATIDLLTGAVAQNPRSAMLFRMLGEAYLWRDDLEAGARALEYSLTLDKMDPITNNLFAEALMKLGQRTRADHYKQQALAAERVQRPCSIR